VSNKFVNADVRWGLTATPFIKSDDFSNNLLRGATGDLLCDISNKELINQGQLTPPRVRIVKVNHQPYYEDPLTREDLTQPKGRGLKWHDMYHFGIVASPPRNQALIREIENAPKPCLVLIQQTKHLKYLEHFGLTKYAVLTGTDSKKKRMQTVEQLRSGEITTIVATTIFDEGVDIPELKSVVLAGGGKSHIKTLQRLGRGLRLAEGKNEVLIVDFEDFNSASPNWMLMKHSKLRKSYYRDEGFIIELGIKDD
jgi:superfamily II DNA or RNA helicase